MIGPQFSLFVMSCLALGVAAETHSIMFINKCGEGTPMLLLQDSSNVLSTGGTYTANGPITDFVAFLQSGNCGVHGEECTAVEGTLQNGSSFANVTVLPPHAFTATTGYGFYGGDDSCDGLGFDCTTQFCSFPFGVNGGTQEECSAANVNLVVTFCD